MVTGFGVDVADCSTFKPTLDLKPSQEPPQDKLSFFLKSDPDLPPDHSSPSPTDEVFDPAPAPPPYMPPQPSIEEARQQMHSLLDDAFALVSPSSQGSAGVGRVSPALPSPSPQPRLQGRQWGSYPAAPSHSPFSSVSGPELDVPSVVMASV